MWVASWKRYPSLFARLSPKDPQSMPCLPLSVDLHALFKPTRCSWVRLDPGLQGQSDFDPLLILALEMVVSFIMVAITLLARHQEIQYRFLDHPSSEYYCYSHEAKWMLPSTNQSLGSQLYRHLWPRHPLSSLRTSCYRKKHLFWETYDLMSGYLVLGFVCFRMFGRTHQSQSWCCCSEQGLLVYSYSHLGQIG